jgi:hypothetical protein
VEPCSRRLANGAVRMFILLGACLCLWGCGDGGRERVAGLEAVPTGYGLEISATTGYGARVEALVVPEAGSFRIELLGERSPAEMLITVRTPETQLGYRSQTILEGEPHPLEMGFLESPLTYSGPYDLDDLAWEGDTCTATLEEDAPGANPGSYAARVDGETGIVVWERQEWDDYRGTIEITRRLVPLPSVKTPSPQDVIDYARADWEESLDVAQNSPFPVYGLDLPGLLLHTLQVGEEDEVTWLRYAEKWHDTWSDDHQVPASGRTLIRGDRSIYIRIYTWALEELGITEPDVEEALMELDRTPAGTPTGKAEPPHLVFDDLMPLPQGADFAETLPLELTR